jgi:UDP-GlcNAc3NAcA epimerase
MMNVLSIVGARPQFIKSAMTSIALRRAGVAERIVHTGQHYDACMSQIFFDELAIPRPAYQLHVGSGPHGEQTGAMLRQIERVLAIENPTVVIVFGDTNSTLAGALAAAKLGIPVAHVEAGLRSFNRQMPEEINRVVTDHVATIHFCPTQTAVTNLAREGIDQRVHHVGDVMYDCAIHFGKSAESRVDPHRRLGVSRGAYALLTCHRAENADDCGRLREIIEGANAIAELLPVLFPVHPRTRKQLERVGLAAHRNLLKIEPLSYLEMLLLERHARVILTDSGGVQKEAFFYGVPCITMRDQTEWPETVEVGANRLCGASGQRMVQAFRAVTERAEPLADAAPYYGSGQASARIAQVLSQFQRAEVSCAG